VEVVTGSRLNGINFLPASPCGRIAGENWGKMAPTGGPRLSAMATRQWEVGQARARIWAEALQKQAGTEENGP
jgi:hypothetical protein